MAKRVNFPMPQWWSSARAAAALACRMLEAEFWMLTMYFRRDPPEVHVIGTRP